MADLAAFEGGAGRRRAGQETVLRAHHHLAVGADVDHGPEIVALVEPRGQRRRDRVGAHEAGDDGQEAHARLRVDPEVEDAGGKDDGVPDDGGVRREADVGRIDPEEDVVHHRVADDRDLVDPLREDAGALEKLGDLLVQERDDPRLKLPQVRRIPLDEGDAGHEVAAERRLRVQAGHGRHHLARGQLEEARHHARRSHVDGEAEGHGRRIAALHGERMVREGDDGDLALGVAEDAREGADHVERDGLGSDSGDARELFEIGGLGPFAPGEVDMDEALPHAGLHLDTRTRHRVVGDAEDLERPLVERGRHAHRRRLDRRRLAGEAVAFADEVVAELELVVDGGRRRRALHELDAARRAAAAPAARRRDLDPLGLAGTQEGSARLDRDGAPVGEERDGHRRHAAILAEGALGTGPLDHGDASLL